MDESPKTESVAARERAYFRAWRLANPEKIIANSRRWRAANREKIRAQNRRYCEANPEKVRTWKRRYYEANPEKIRAYYLANREKMCALRRRYYEANRDRCIEALYVWRKLHPEAYDRSQARSKLQRATRIPSKLIPISLVELKLRLIKIKRLCRTTQKSTRAANTTTSSI
jgi:hypothetical protein